MSQALSDGSFNSKKKNLAIRVAVKVGLALAAMGAIMFLVIRLTESMM